MFLRRSPILTASIAVMLLTVFTMVTVDAAVQICKDSIHNCKDYGKGSCGGQYVTWAKQNCPAYCGFCKAPPCVDAVPKCETFQKDTCYSAKYRIWAEKNCRRYCRLCTDDQLRYLDSIPSAYCKDKIKDCKHYNHGSCTGKFTQWAKSNCAATCGYCKALPTPATPCVDNIHDCHAHTNPEQFCNLPIYRKWADTNCRKFCGLC